MSLHVTSAKPLDGYRIEVCFNDGREGIADLAESLEGPMFGLLKDPEAFRKFRVDEELQTIVWPNGADLAPEYIYYQTFRDDPELQVTFHKWGYIAASDKPMNQSKKDDLRPEYSAEFIRSGIRGKYAKRFKEGSNVVVIDPDLSDAFPNSEAVNQALRDYLANQDRAVT